MKNKHYESKCQGETVRGHAQQIITVYEGRGYAAQRAGNEHMAHIYFQHAEHCKRI